MEGNRRVDQDKAAAEKLKDEIARIDREVLKLAGGNGHEKKKPEAQTRKKRLDGTA